MQTHRTPTEDETEASRGITNEHQITLPKRSRGNKFIYYNNHRNSLLYMYHLLTGLV